MTATPTQRLQAYLMPIAGPVLEPLVLDAQKDAMTLGRHEQCDLRLPISAETVSRFHARLSHNGVRWSIADLKSRWGTFVNGQKLEPERDMPLNDGDLVRIQPWTFSISPTPRQRGLKPGDDTGQTLVRAVSQETVRPLADAVLALLLESAAAIHSASSEKELADLLIDAGVRGTGMSNAFVLRPLDGEGHLQVIASHTAGEQQSGAAFSRSLINTASGGVVAEMGTGQQNISQSMVQLQISSALCVPLVLGQSAGGGSVALYLYLDSRGSLARPLRPGATAFCVALGRMASLALANLKRIDMEKRQATIEADFRAAATAQRWIMPKRSTSFGPFTCVGESRPGQYVGGDFFDLIPLSDTLLAVAVGDVSGKGITASVLMTASQGFLHASLRKHLRADLAVRELNQFICPRRPEGKFVTMWVGVFDAENGTVRYVDAGHSYALLQRQDRSILQLDEGGGLPIGVDESAEYSDAVAPFASGDRAIVVSDGIIEQFGMVDTDSGPSRQQFEVEGVKRALLAQTEDLVAHLFDQVIAHAGTSKLSDDATGVLVRW
jgi:phosphoserine phosphatase RsbU/P